MHSPDFLYQYIIESVLKGEEIQSRNSKVMRTFNISCTYNTTPLISLRKTAWKNCLKEMEWFLSGSDNINDLDKSVRHWWKPWANSSGQILNNYGKQFRNFTGNSYIKVSNNHKFKTVDQTDQIETIINNIKKDPFSRRHVITVWNTHDMNNPNTPLTNCHSTVIQFFVSNKDTLNMTMYQRSCDVMLGLPHNIFQHYAFLMWVSHRTEKKVGTFTHHLGDAHIYWDHLETAKKLLELDCNLKNPELIYKSSSGEFLSQDFKLKGKYSPVNLDKLKMVV